MEMSLTVPKLGRTKDTYSSLNFCPRCVHALEHAHTVTVMYSTYDLHSFRRGGFKFLRILIPEEVTKMNPNNNNIK